MNYPYNADKSDIYRETIGRKKIQIALFNDTGRYPHVGCKGVTLGNDRMLRRIGAHVALRSFHGEWTELGKTSPAEGLKAFRRSELPRLLESVDAVVVNGEGTIHHEGGRHLIAILAGAQAMGKPTYLVNAVIQACEYDFRTLRRLDDLTVRDLCSSEYLARHGVAHRMVLDSIFEAGFSTEVKNDFGGRIVVTDWHGAREADVGVAMRNLCETLGRDAIYYPLEGGERDNDWMNAVADFRTARLVVTGRHHGVCIAALAGVPFVALGSNTWKIEGLLKAFPGDFKQCESTDDIIGQCENAVAERASFVNLRDFVSSQLPLPTFDKLSERFSMNHSPSTAFLSQHGDLPVGSRVARAGESIEVGMPTKSYENEALHSIGPELQHLVLNLARFFGDKEIVQLEQTDSGLPKAIRHRIDGSIVSTISGIDRSSTKSSFDVSSAGTVFCVGWLAALSEEELNVLLPQFHRVSGGNLWISMEATATRNQNWWEKKFFEAGFRKHPLVMRVVPYPQHERDVSRVVLVMEKIPASALARYPLEALKAERDLHMDMLREAGVRSEAHLVRYQLAAKHAPSEGVILDAACGLGYGSAMLARQFPNVRVIGVDISEYAIDYARANFAAELPNLEFHLADACDLHMISEGSVDLVVSFETIEHVPDPELFLMGVVRRMKAGAKFIGSVPNLWLDETGKDPNPWHFHVFDLPKFYQLIAGFLQVSNVYRENAGGHLRNTKAGPDMREVNLPVTDQLEEAEWWLLAATKSSARTASSRPKPRVWLVDGDVRGRFYTQLQSAFEAEWLVGPDVVPTELDLALVSDEWCWENSLEVQRLKQLGVPTLHLVDGVVDWKNSWENPRSLDGNSGPPLFQPVLADKIACLGSVQARILGAWGNGSKCEVVGAPRFDRYYGLKRRTRRPEEPARILILTPNTAFFNAEQHAAVFAGLRDLKNFFESVARNGIPVEPVWRLTSGLDGELGLPPSTPCDIAEVLCGVDAVVGASSTALLEAMLLGLPTALLDYSNGPHYLQPAWRITAESQIAPTLGELLNPTRPKMLHQEMVLHDNLACASPSTSRLVRLVEAMIEEGRRARSEGRTPSFQTDMLSDRAVTQVARENRFDLAQLYPKHPVFKLNTIAELQVELNHWQRRHAAFQRGAGPLRGGDVAGENAVKAYAEKQIPWRSKLEAAHVLISLGHVKPAVELMLQAVRTVESFKDPHLILDALLAICESLWAHDGGRARVLLQTAHKLAARLSRPQDARRAAELLAKLPETKNKAA